jgi:hypothetical protein
MSRLQILVRQVKREMKALERLRQDAAQYQGQRDYPALVELAEERLASAEALLLLAREREVLWHKVESASQALRPPSAPPSAPEVPTPLAKPSSDV